MGQSLRQRCLITMLAVAVCTSRSQLNLDAAEFRATQASEARQPLFHTHRGDFDVPDPADGGRGGQVYASVCSTCHQQGLNHAPQLAMLALMTPESIYRALSVGVMRSQAAAAQLSEDDRVKVSEYLSGRRIGDERKSAPLMCKPGRSPFLLSEPPVFAGWGLDERNSHAISAVVAGLDKRNVGRLRLKWELAFPDATRARSQPALAAGAIFVGSHDGTVFALDRKTGCARWLFNAGAEVRTGIVISDWKAGDSVAQPLAYFGDLVGNVYALNARSGELVWKVRPDEHPNATITATPVLHKKRLYVSIASLEEARADPKYECCTFRGSLVALEAATGAPIWQTFTVDPPKLQGTNAVGTRQFGPAGVALWDSPAIDEKRGRLYVGTGDNYSSPATSLSDSIIALDLATGRIIWAYQAFAGDAWNGACEMVDRTNCPAEDGPDYDFGASPLLATGSNGKDYVLAAQKSGMVYALEPDSGALIWKRKLGRGGVLAGIHFGIATVGDAVFVPVSDAPDGHEHSDPAQPGLYALDIRTGELRWQAPSEDVCARRTFCHPGYAGSITATPQLVVAGAGDGHLRIYDTASGAILWDFDTVRDFNTVNGMVARGGSMGGGAAPLAYRGMLIMTSGYGFGWSMPGNVLMVFEAR